MRPMIRLKSHNQIQKVTPRPFCGRDPKIPTFIISIPFIHRPSGLFVSWIECVAEFGIPCQYDSNQAPKMERFVRKFGPGMLLYAYGYVRSLRNTCVAKDIVVCDEVPSLLNSVSSRSNYYFDYSRLYTMQDE
ncbi:hypothetical protein ACOME3_004478 [Neoechinorhynchus agilis]